MAAEKRATLDQVLAVVPARSGSKGIVGKNLRTVAGKPLLAYACEAALSSQRVTRTLVSTDSVAIADVARSCGAEVPFLRPTSLAGDETPMLHVLMDVLASLTAAEGYRADAVVLLQPTSPLRTAAHVDAALALLEQSGADSVVSVVEVPHQFGPTSVMTLDGERLVPYLEDAETATRRQDKPRVFARNGPAVLAVRASVLEGGSLYGRDCRPLVMRAEESVDVDEPFDLEVAEWLLVRRAPVV